MEKHEEDPEIIILKSRKLIVDGNKLASEGKFKEAIELYTKSIKLDPSDHRFYGNRSYCYDRLCLFDKALKDAEKSIKLSHVWPKGYFRKGRALLGLKKYALAEKCFLEALKLDNDCEEAMCELEKAKILQIMEKGYTKEVAEAALSKHCSVKETLNSLLSSGIFQVSNQNDSDIFISDEEIESTGKAPATPKPVTYSSLLSSGISQDGSDVSISDNGIKSTWKAPATPKPVTYSSMLSSGISQDDSDVFISDNGIKSTWKAPATPKPVTYSSLLSSGISQDKVQNDSDNFISDDENESTWITVPVKQKSITQSPNYDINEDPKNPEGRNSLWIGNVQPDVTEKELIAMFGKYGEILSAKVMPEKTCAFINYKSKRSAGKAMRAYQGFKLNDAILKIRYPSLPEEATPSKTVKKPGVLEQKLRNLGINPHECYFWRHHGCFREEACTFLHVKESKGVDL